MHLTLSTDEQAGIARIGFAWPPHNFVSPALLGELADAVEAIDRDPAIRCSVLTSGGKAFCAGADLAGGDLGGEDGMAAVAALYGQAERLFRRRKPIVAAIQGAAVGAGLGLALAADFRVASPDARFVSNFVRLGFHPGFGLSVTLPRLIGWQKAHWMMLSAERIKADTALGWGLIDALVPADELAGEADRMAAAIAANAPLALIAVRATMPGGFAGEVTAAMARELAEQTRLKPTLDHAEGVASVFERRDARFVGR